MITMPFKTLNLLLCAAFISLPATAEDDPWVGRFRSAWLQGAPGTDGEVAISPVPATGKAEGNGARWLFTSPGKNRSIELRRFRDEEYEGLQSSAPVQCLNGGEVALCRVKPGATIAFDGGGPVPEKFVARSGYFGIFMRNGVAVFELTKLNPAP